MSKRGKSTANKVIALAYLHRYSWIALTLGVLIIWPEYMFYFYHSRIYKECIFSVSRTAQAGFNKEDLNNLYIPLPPLEEQKRIILQVSSILSKLDIISNALL